MTSEPDPPRGTPPRGPPDLDDPGDRDDEPGLEPGAEPEFDDEPPGSYLRELGVRGWNVAVACVVLAGTIAVGAVGLSGSVPEAWLPPARVVWVFLPVIASVTFIITLWQHLSSFTPHVPGKSRAALAISLAAAILWGVFRWLGAYVS